MHGCEHSDVSDGPVDLSMLNNIFTVHGCETCRLLSCLPVERCLFNYDIALLEVPTFFLAVCPKQVKIYTDWLHNTSNH